MAQSVRDQHWLNNESNKQDPEWAVIGSIGFDLLRQSDVFLIVVGLFVMMMGAQSIILDKEFAEKNGQRLCPKRSCMSQPLTSLPTLLGIGEQEKLLLKKLPLNPANLGRVIVFLTLTTETDKVNRLH